MSTTVTYKGSTLTTVENETRTLTTRGKYLEDNITLVDETVPFEPELQTKSKAYTPTTSQQTDVITYDNGYDGLEEVDITVNAVPTGVFDVMVVATESDTSISVSSSGLITAEVEGSISAHPILTAGYFDTSDSIDVVLEGYKTYQLPTQAGTTITPSTTQQTAVTSGKYTTGNVIVSAMPNGSAGTPTATKGSVSNHSVSVTPSVTNTTGYITGSTKTGTAVTVSASELVSGSQTITSNQTVDVTNLAEVVVNVSGGGGISADDIALKTLSGVVSGSAASIAQSAFTNFKYLNGAVFQSATSVGVSAFYGCNLLSIASFPNATTLSTNAFGMCYSINTTDFGKVETIGAQAFQNCSSLTTASFPNATSMGASAFLTCSSLTTAYFPKLSSIPRDAFASCKSLITTNFEMAQTISSQAFYSCSSLATASFPKVTTIGNSAFMRCRMLLSLYLLGSSVPTLANVAVFSSTPISGYTTHTGGTYGSIYVPASLYNTYISATNWGSYSARIVSV